MTLGLTILTTWYWCTDQVSLEGRNSNTRGVRIDLYTGIGIRLILYLYLLSTELLLFLRIFFFTSNTHEKCPSLFVLTDIIQAGVFVPHRSLVSSTKKHLWNAIVVFAEEFYILFFVFLVLAGLSKTCHEVTSCWFPVVLKDLHSEAHFVYKPQCVWLYLSFLARWLISRLRHWKACLY